MKTNLTNWLSALCAILIIVLLVLQTKQKNQIETLRQQHDAFVIATTQSQQEAKEKTAEIANAIQQNTAVLHRAIGNKLAVELPKSVTNELAALEARIADTNSWPQDSTNAYKMIAKLRDLVRQIPPWAEEDYLPRLNAVRWGTSALPLIAKAQTVTDDELDDYIGALDASIQAKPDDASELVANRLADIRSRPDLINRILKKLDYDKSRSLSDGVSNFIESANAGLSQATNEPSQTIRQISFGKLLDSVISQRQILLENTNADASLPASLTDLAARIEAAIAAENKSEVAEQEKKLRDYQRWALSQIQSFNNDFATAASMITYKSDTSRIKNDMIKYLVPISVGFLDPAVSRLYNEAFEGGWGKLDNNLKTEVAKQEVVIQKQKP